MLIFYLKNCGIAFYFTGKTALSTKFYENQQIYNCKTFDLFVLHLENFAKKFI